MKKQIRRSTYIAPDTKPRQAKRHVGRAVRFVTDGVHILRQEKNWAPNHPIQLERVS